MKKFLYPLIAIALLCALLTLASCDLAGKQTSTTTTARKPEATTEPSSEPVEGIPADSVVMTIGDFEVSKALFLYYYNTILANYEYEDKDFLNKTENAKEKVATEALEECKKDALYQKLFKECGGKLPDDYEKQYTEYKQETSTYFFYYYGISLDAYMEQSGMTEEIFKMFYTEDSIYFPAIQKYLTEGDAPKADITEEAFAEFSKDYATVRHILVGYTDGLTPEEAEKRANEMIDRYKKGEKFEDLQKEYSNDYQKEGDNVYTFTYGEMVKEFEEMSFKLKEHEISEPVKTQFGYHVILRLPYPDDFKENLFYPHATNQYIDETSKELTETKTALYDVMIDELE